MGLLPAATPVAVSLYSPPSSLLIAFTISSFSFRTARNINKIVRNSDQVGASAYKHTHIHYDHNVYRNAENVCKHLGVYFHVSIGKLVVIVYIDSRQSSMSYVTVIIQVYLIVKR